MSQDPALRVGAARRDITPPQPTLLYPTGMTRTRPTEGVLDPLYVEALAIEAGGELAFITTSDLRFVERDWVFDIRQEVARRTGCHEHQVHLSAVHNHCSSPELTAKSPPEAKAALDEANHKIIGAFVEACVAARDALRPAELGYAQAELRETVGENRRMRLSNGTCVNCWGSGPVCPPGHRMVGPAGPAATTIWMLIFREVGRKKPFAVLTDYPSHPHLCEVPYFSGEVPGAAKRQIERRLPGVTVLYGHSTGGDIDMHCVHPMATASLEATVAWFRASQKLLGRRLADAVVPAVKACRTFKRPRTMRHQYWAENETRSQDDGLLDIVSGLALGDAAVVTLQGELFLELGLEIRRRSPFKKLVMLGYNGGGCGYVPKPLAFEQGSYEVNRGPGEPDENKFVTGPSSWTRRTKRDAGDRAVAKVLEILAAMK